jgi:phytoene synthase
MLTPSAAIVQRHDPERFVTVLFAPEAARETLFTLYAFNHELARAREVASMPTLALIRLQWWREVVDGAQRGHEVATPLHEAIANGRLDPAALHSMIDARMLEAEECVDENAWADYLRGGAGTLMREAGRLLGAADCAEALTLCGAGCGAVGLLRNACAYQGAGRWITPDGRGLDWAREQASTLLGERRAWPDRAIPAALPVLWARRHLARGEGHDPWARLALWRAARRGAF